MEFYDIIVSAPKIIYAHYLSNPGFTQVWNHGSLDYMDSTISLPLKFYNTIL